jgi:hypothetical protein
MIGKAGLWGVPGSVTSDVITLQAQYATRYAAAEKAETRTPTAVLMKDETRDALIKAIREVNRVYLANGPAVTDEDRMNMGLPIHKTTRTPAPVADNAPAFRVDTGTMYRLIIHFFTAGSEKSRAKPPGQHGVEIRWAVSDVPVEDADALVHSAFDTRTPYPHDFQGHERGKTVYLALRWENTRGEKGPWSPVQNAIIP